jgi:hypothetical protein
VVASGCVIRVVQERQKMKYKSPFGYKTLLLQPGKTYEEAHGLLSYDGIYGAYPFLEVPDTDDYIARWLFGNGAMMNLIESKKWVYQWVYWRQEE